MMTDHYQPLLYHSACPGQRGFTLIELVVVLVVLGLLALFAVELIPKLTDRIRLDQTVVSLEQAKEAVTGFVLANNRLPCPDTNNNGLEGGGASGVCAATDRVGVLPFRSMGLPGPALDRSRLPLRYGVYRNAGVSADLATLTELFEPALPDELTITPGTVTGCNQTLATPVVRIAYSNPPLITLKITPVSGSFQADEFLGFVNIGFTGLTSVTPPAPSSPVAVPFDLFHSDSTGFANCPCGITVSPNSCSVCTGFSVGRPVTSDPSDDEPSMVIKVGSGSSLVGYPGGNFQVGDTLSELYTAPNPNYITPPRVVTNTNPPPATVTTTKLLTGVTATISSVVNKSAHIISVSGPFSSPPDTLVIDLPPQTPFAAPETVYGATSHAIGTVVSQTTLQTTFDDTTPESVTGSGGGSATIDAGSDTGRSFTVSGGVTGSIVPGNTITGSISGTQATVVAVSSDSSSTPVIIPGSIAFTPTHSNQTNELDFCRSLHNAIAAAGDTGSTNFVHTVNQDHVTSNPAYLLVSGGVVDASGDGLHGSFDQRNQKTPLLLDFESPARKRNDAAVSGVVYDDIVASVPMKGLASSLSCARNTAAVNALAVDATALRNLAEVSFDLNEQALNMISVSFRQLEQAKVNRDIAAVQLVLEAVSIAIEVYVLLEYPEGFVATAVIIAADLASLAAVIGELVAAVEAVTAAEGTYASACTSQLGTASNLNNAIPAAATARKLGLRGDAWGGVQ